MNRIRILDLLVVAAIGVFGWAWIAGGYYQAALKVLLCLVFGIVETVLAWNSRRTGDPEPGERRRVCVVLYVHALVAADLWHSAALLTIAISVSIVPIGWRRAVLWAGLAAVGLLTCCGPLVGSRPVFVALAISMLAAVCWTWPHTTEAKLDEAAAALSRDARGHPARTRRTWILDGSIAAMVAVLGRSWFTVAGLYHVLTMVPLCLLFTGVEVVLDRIARRLGEPEPAVRRRFCIVLYLHGMIVPDFYFPPALLAFAIAVSCTSGRWRSAALGVGLITIAAMTRFRMPLPTAVCALAITLLAATTMWLLPRAIEKRSDGSRAKSP